MTERDRTIPELLAVSDAEARRLLRIALEEGQKVQDRAERLEAELREAREALAPFAELATEVDALHHEDESTCPHRLKAGHIRRARGVLEKGTGGT